MDTIRVTCGLIYDNEKVFICRRKQSKSLGGYWEFPGGKIEDGESSDECLKRKLFEELEMKVEEIRHFMTVHHEYETFKIELISFLCSYISCSYKMPDHNKFEWINTEELKKFKLAPADIPIADALIVKMCKKS